MKRLFFSACITILSVQFSMGTTYEDIPTPRFDSKSNEQIVSLKSPCNQGEEPFYKFFSEFQMGDSSFIAERTLINGQKLTIDELNSDYIFDILQSTDFIVSERQTGFYVENDEIVTFHLTSSWFNVSKDNVYFASGEVYDGKISIGKAVAFERINNKWYLTFIIEAG